MGMQAEKEDAQRQPPRCWFVLTLLQIEPQRGAKTTFTSAEGRGREGGTDGSGSTISSMGQ